MNPTLKDPFLPEPDAAAYLSPFVPRQSPPSSSWESAVAELYLHLPELAVESLAALDGTATDTVETAALRLLALEQTGNIPSNVLALMCREALERFGYQPRILELALIHFVEAKVFDQALELWGQFGDGAWRRESRSTVAHFLHNVACALAGEGRYVEAVVIIAIASETHRTPADLLMDHDLLPLWEYMAGHAKAGFSEDEACVYGSLGFRRILSHAESGRILRTLATSAVQEVLPARLRPWFRRSISSHWILEPMCPTHIKRSYFEWLEDLRRQKLALLPSVVDWSGKRSPEPQSSPG